MQISSRVALSLLIACMVAFFHARVTSAATAGVPGPNDLAIVEQGHSDAVVVLAPDAGPFERQAAADLVKYIGLISGAQPALSRTAESVASALASNRPLILIGRAALSERPDLQAELQAKLKPAPFLRADGIVLRREDNRVYVAGANDRSHYFAVAELLKRWGVRWYMPGPFGEVVPNENRLAVGSLDYAYAPPFEIRSYWVSWLGEQTTRADFQLRNMMTDPREVPPTGHALGRYTKGLGTTPFDIALTAPATADQVAREVGPRFDKGEDFSLAMDDGLYESRDPGDAALAHLQWDKDMMRWSVTDPMLELYNSVLTRLRARNPESRSKVGFLAYSNMTLPPVRALQVDPALFAELAPIDVDPNHGMDDPRSPQRGAYRSIMERWAAVMNRHLAIYDYDQSMLIWRDLPNPSHAVFRQDVQHYRAAGILGINTESRGALATTFLNLYFRAQLMWDPDFDVDAALADFFPRFFGPAAEPMRAYWQAIFAAWSATSVTEHEYFVAPAIYTSDLVEQLRQDLAKAELLIHPLQEKGQGLSINEKLYIERIRFMRLSFEVMDAYTAMVRDAATNGDYAAAIVDGQRGLAARDGLTAMSKTFTTTRMETGYAWWTGEVRQYAELQPLIDGSRGRLVTLLPLVWPVRRDPDRTGLVRGYAVEPIDRGASKAGGPGAAVSQRTDSPEAWEALRTDLYAGAQGVTGADGRGFVGDLWYRTDIDLKEQQASGALHLMLPGVFGSCRLFVDGTEVARRDQDSLWWRNDYRFQWDVNLSGRVKAGYNGLALACDSQGRFAGVFRRPFLYEEQATGAAIR